MGHLLDLALPRLYSEEPLRQPLYRCGVCRSPRVASAYYLPLAGYVRHGGRCNVCGQSLPLRALFLPLGGMALFALAFLAIDGIGAALLSGFFAVIFLALAATDLERGLIPNRLTYPALLLAAAFAWAWPEHGVVSTFAGGGAALALMVALYILGRGALGFGDVKMAALLGLVAGLGGALFGLLLGAMVAGGVVAVLLALRVVRRGDYIPYGPFIALGAIVAILWGGPVVDWYMD